MKIRYDTHTRKCRTGIAILVASIVLTTPSVSRGFGTVPPFVTIHNDCIGGIWWVVIDPQSVESFQLDFQFDPSLVSFGELAFESPYIQTSPADFSLLPSGLLQDVAGTSSIFPPPAGHVDIFRVRFETVNPTLPPVLGQFTVFASAND